MRRLTSRRFSSPNVAQFRHATAASRQVRRPGIGPREILITVTFLSAIQFSAAVLTAASQTSRHARHS